MDSRTATTLLKEYQSAELSPTLKEFLKRLYCLILDGTSYEDYYLGCAATAAENKKLKDLQDEIFHYLSSRQYSCTCHIKDSSYVKFYSIGIQLNDVTTHAA